MLNKILIVLCIIISLILFSYCFWYLFIEHFLRPIVLFVLMLITSIGSA